MLVLPQRPSSANEEGHRKVRVEEGAPMEDGDLVLAIIVVIGIIVAGGIVVVDDWRSRSKATDRRKVTAGPGT